MPHSLFIETPDTFNFKSTIYSHGWCELAPFEIDEESWRLSYVFINGRARTPVFATISEEAGRLKIALDRKPADSKEMINDARHLLRLDDDLNGLYEAVVGHERLDWVSKKGAGRMLRSPTVFEDLVKTICTTNCSWGLTKSMVTNLVEKLGTPTKTGKRAFPAPEAMAGVTEDFYRNEIRAGYRAPFRGTCRSCCCRKIRSAGLADLRSPDARTKKRNEEGQRRRRLRRRESVETRRTLRRARTRFVASLAVLQKPQQRKSLP